MIKLLQDLDLRSEIEKSNLSPELETFLIMAVYQIVDKNVMNLSKLEMKIIFDMIEIFDKRLEASKATERQKFDRESTKALIFQKVSQIIPLRNYLLTRTHFIKHIQQEYVSINSLLAIYNSVFSSLDHLYQSKDFQALVKQGIMSSDLNLSIVISSSLGDKITDQEYLGLCFGYYMFDLAPKQRKDQTNPMNYNYQDTVQNWLIAGMIDKSTSEFAKATAQVTKKQDHVKVKGSKDKFEEHKDTLNSKEKEALMATKNKILTLMGRIKAYFCLNNIHRDLGYLKTLLKLVGNFFAQRNNVSLQKHFYSPELVAAVIDMKSNQYCRDIQFLAFTLLSTVPSSCRPPSPSRRAQSRQQAGGRCHRRGSQLRRQADRRLPV